MKKALLFLLITTCALAQQNTFPPSGTGGSIPVPLTVPLGGTNCITASITCVNNISGGSLAGAVVGTTDTQSLTNKTLDGVTPTVMGYLDATSSIQTQLNAKAGGASNLSTANALAVVSSAGVLGQDASILAAAGVLYPAADSTTAIQFDKADHMTNVVTVDTTNGLLKATGFVGLATGSTAQLSLTDPTSGSRYIWSSQNQDATKGPFNAVVGTALFASTYDEVLAEGYNCQNGGGGLLATEPSFCNRIEQDYQVATTHYMEAYSEFYCPTSICGSTIQARPIFMQLNKATGVMTDFEMRNTGINFTNWADSSVYATLSNGGFTLSGLATQSADTQLNVNAQNGHNGELAMSGGVLFSKVGGIWDLSVGGLLQLDAGINVTAGNVSVGRQQSAFTLNNNWSYTSNLTLTCQSGSTACDNGAIMGHFTSTANVGSGGNKYINYIGVNMDIADSGSNGDYLAAINVNMHPTNTNALVANRHIMQTNGGDIWNKGATSDSTSASFNFQNSSAATVLYGRDDGVVKWGAGVVVAALPSCASAVLGGRIMVTDATVATPGTAPTGSGTYTVPVVCIYNSMGTSYSWQID